MFISPQPDRLHTRPQSPSSPVPPRPGEIMPARRLAPIAALLLAALAGCEDNLLRPDDGSAGDDGGAPDAAMILDGTTGGGCGAPDQACCANDTCAGGACCVAS